MLALAAIMLVVSLSLWTLFPWADRAYTLDRGHDALTRVEKTRSYRLLPRAEWGFSCRHTNFDGPTWGEQEESCIGFLEMTDMTSMTFIPR